MKTTLLLSLFLIRSIQISAFDILPTETLQYIFNFSIQKNEDISPLNLVSKQFYAVLWNNKKALLLNRYLDYEILHDNENYNIEHINHHFHLLYSPENTLLDLPLLASTQQWIEKQYKEKRIHNVFISLSHQHLLFKDFLKKGDITSSKNQLNINNIPLLYKEYFYKKLRIIVTSGLRDFSLEQRKQLVFPFLQYCHQLQGLAKVLLRFLTFHDIFDRIDEQNIHLFRCVVDPMGNPLLLSLVDHNQSTLINLYAQKKENVNVINLLGESALHRAKNQNMLSLLLSLPIDPHLQSHDGNEAFHKLCISSPFMEIRAAILLCFLEAGFDINTKTKSGKTLLHLACLSDLHDVARNIFKYQMIDVNAQDKNGNTALHNACQINSMAIISLLLRHGARFDIKNNENKIAFDYIKRRYQRNMLKLICDGLSL